MKLSFGRSKTDNLKADTCVWIVPRHGQGSFPESPGIVCVKFIVFERLWPASVFVASLIHMLMHEMYMYMYVMSSQKPILDRFR